MNKPQNLQTSVQFYEDNKEIAVDRALIDNSVIVHTIETPEGWRCDRCTAEYKHSHTTYLSL